MDKGDGDISDSSDDASDTYFLYRDLFLLIVAVLCFISCILKEVK